MEVHYTCQAQKKFSSTYHSGTTNKPLPPWLLDLAATPSSATPTTTEKSTTAISSAEKPLSNATPSIIDRTVQERTVPNPIHKKTEEVVIPNKDTTDKEEQLEEEMRSDTGDIIVEKHIVSDNTDELYEGDEDDLEDDSETDDFDKQLHILEKIVDHCPPRTVQNLFWNWTRAGDEAIQVCPQGSSGFARWRCGVNGDWEPESAPNLGECQSLWLSRMEQRLGRQSDSQDTQTISQIAVELSGATETRPDRKSVV